ncbi:MAG: hypothetical protein KDK70_10045 [Myxococcales bacterium]|nr:hypothetical protein [Myxococcales bacterium]
MSTQGFTGATYQSLAHGLTTGALFMAIGILYERRHTRLISEFGGLAKVMPWFTAFFMIAMLGSAGLPSLVGFVGEFLIVVGAFTDGGLTLVDAPLLVAVGAIGVILGAVYLLYLFQRLMFGPITNPKNQELADLGLRERLVFAPVIILIIVMGVYPKPFLERIDPTSQAAVASFNFKRCLSIRHSLGERPVLAKSLADRCADPVAVIADTYGDQRFSAMDAEPPPKPAPAVGANPTDAKAPEAPPAGDAKAAPVPGIRPAPARPAGDAKAPGRPAPGRPAPGRPAPARPAGDAKAPAGVPTRPAGDAKAPARPRGGQ